MSDQLEMFSAPVVTAETRFAATPPRDIDDRIIDAALHHVEKQWVLRDLKRGETWSQAAGIGGCWGKDLPYWMTGANGIEVGSIKDKRIIPIARIMQRVAQYAPIIHAT